MGDCYTHRAERGNVFVLFHMYLMHLNTRRLNHYVLLSDAIRRPETRGLNWGGAVG